MMSPRKHRVSEAHPVFVRIEGQVVSAAGGVVVLATPGDPISLLPTVKRVVDYTVTPTVATLVAEFERNVRP